MNNDLESQFDSAFLLLGAKEQFNLQSEEEITKRIKVYGNKPKEIGVWASLGWKNNQPFSFEILNSKVGNREELKRDRSAKNCIQNLQSFNDEIKNVKNDVLERYIDFQDEDFGINWLDIENVNQIPDLKLVLFVEETEGAMVYYQHQYKNREGLSEDQYVFEEYIQCEKTENYTSQRDRLIYHFPVLPPFQYETDALGNIFWLKKNRETSFKLKIITFKRKSGDNKALLKDFFDKEKLAVHIKSKGQTLTYDLFGSRKNSLLIYDDTVVVSSVASKKMNRYDMRGAFFNVDDEHSIDYSKKNAFVDSWNLFKYT